MSVNNFWNSDKAIEEAERFLQFGNYAGVQNIGVIGGNKYPCTSSTTCPVGFKCVNGYCEPPDNLGGEGGYQNPGSCGSGGSGGGGCGGGGGGGCTTTSGGCSPNPGQECCSEERCCRYSGTGAGLAVTCNCGPCPPPPPTCNEFCAAYSAANGTSAGGCSSNDECDECSQCELFEGEHQCVPKENGAPCHCGGSCGECEECNANGSCEYTGAGCQECCTVYFKCDCGIELGRTCCQPVQTGTQFYTETCIGRCRALMNQQCSELCSNPPDPPDPTPDPIEPCDCNCDNDCGDCQICNSEGKCVPDPTCGICSEGQTLCEDLQTCCQEGFRCVSIYSNVFQTSSSGSTSTFGSVGPIQYGFEGANGDPKNCSSCNPTRPRMVIYNSNLYDDEVCNGGITRKVCYQDSVCFGAEAFTPVLISSQISSVRCCAIN